MLIINKSGLAALATAFVFVNTNDWVVESFAPSSNTRNAPGSSFNNAARVVPEQQLPSSSTQLHLSTKVKPKINGIGGIATTKPKLGKLPLVSRKSNGASVVEIVDESSDGELSDAKKIELIALAVWGVSISAFILINNSYGPWPLFMKQVPERWFFLSHMIGGMLFGGGIILTTCIERAVAKSNNPGVLQFWFDKVPELDGLIVVPALTVSMISGTGLSIVRYGGLNIAPPPRRRDILDPHLLPVVVGGDRPHDPGDRPQGRREDVRALSGRGGGPGNAQGRGGSALQQRRVVLLHPDPLFHDGAEARHVGPSRGLRNGDIGSIERDCACHLMREREIDAAR